MQKETLLHRTITMPAQPANPQSTEEAHAPHKQQAPLNANG